MTTSAVILGTSPDGNPITFDYNTDGHLLIAGAAESGKTCTAKHLAWEATDNDFEVDIISPQAGADYGMIPGVSSVSQDRATALEVLLAATKDAIERTKLLALHEKEQFDGLPGQVQPPRRLIVIDQYLEMITPERVKTADRPEFLEIQAEDLAGAHIEAAVKKLARDGSRVGINVVVVVQDPGPETKRLALHMSVLLQGEVSASARHMVLKNPPGATYSGSTDPGYGLLERLHGPAAEEIALFGVLPR